MNVFDTAIMTCLVPHEFLIVLLEGCESTGLRLSETSFYAVEGLKLFSESLKVSCCFYPIQYFLLHEDFFENGQ